MFSPCFCLIFLIYFSFCFYLFGFILHTFTDWHVLASSVFLPLLFLMFFCSLPAVYFWMLITVPVLWTVLSENQLEFVPWKILWTGCETPKKFLCSCATCIPRGSCFLQKGACSYSTGRSLAPVDWILWPGGETFFFFLLAFLSWQWTLGFFLLYDKYGPIQHGSLLVFWFCTLVSRIFLTEDAVDVRTIMLWYTASICTQHVM